MRRVQRGVTPSETSRKSWGGVVMGIVMPRSSPQYKQLSGQFVVLVSVLDVGVYAFYLRKSGEIPCVLVLTYPCSRG